MKQTLSMPSVPTPNSKYLRYGATAFVLLFLLFSCFRVVGVGQVGLVTRFGKVVREEQSGIVVKFPWPVEKLNLLNIQVQKEQVDSNASTADLQDVSTTLALNYHLDGKYAKDIYTNVGPLYKYKIVDPALQEAFKATSAQYTASDLLTKRAEVKEKALSVLKSRLEKHHITVDDVSIVNFQFSSEFTQAIESKQAAAQNAEKAKYDLEKAQLDAQAQAVQKASLSPELLQKYAIDKWDGKMPQYVGSGTVFNIPLNNQ